MKIFKSAIVILLFLIPISIILGSIGFSSANSSEEEKGFEYYEHNLTQGFIDQPDDDREIFYWIQVSDIHINMADEGKKNRENFEEFCSDTIPVIAPGFVLSSGDNVNGRLGEDDKPKQFYQDEDQYEFFRDTLDEYGLNSSFYYIGIGNHEIYNEGLDRSLFFEYLSNNTKYYFDVDAPCGTYRFICLDTTQHAGLCNPFNYWGEMTRERLNELENLLEDTPKKVDQLIFWGHQPINFIYSERSDSGKTFKDLIFESDAAIYLCGHLHTSNTYWNHGSLTELECPAFTEGSHFRIVAVDNGFYSFSDEISGEWPAIVITNPISNLFYNDQTDFSNMVKAKEIRALIFDPKSIEEAHVEIDGKRIGELKHQNQSLWTLSFDPDKYDTGNHELKIVVESESGKTSRSLTFNLEDFSTVQTGGMSKFLIAVDLMIALTCILALCFVLLYSFTVLPKLYYYSSESRRKKLSEINREDFKDKGFFKRHCLKKWFQAATLPFSSWLALILVPTYMLLGPIFVGPIINNTWGVVWIYGFSIIGEHVLDFYSLIWAILFLLLFRIVQGFTIRSNQPNPNKWRFAPLMVFFLAWGGIIWFYSGYFTYVVMLINPMVILSLVSSMFLVWNSREKSRSKLMLNARNFPST